MTIDEAISNYQGISNYLQRYHVPDEEVQLQITNARCIEWFTEVAEWLRELKEAKRLLKMAVEDLSKMPCNNDTHSPGSCYICVKHGNCSYTDSFKWCKADIALKLIGESNEP